MLTTLPRLLQRDLRDFLCFSCVSGKALCRYLKRWSIALCLFLPASVALCRLLGEGKQRGDRRSVDVGSFIKATYIKGKTAHHYCLVAILYYNV